MTWSCRNSTGINLSGFFNSNTIAFSLTATINSKENTMKKILIVTMLLSLLSLFGLSGCSTVEGVGKDIQKGGEAIENTAKKH